MDEETARRKIMEIAEFTKQNPDYLTNKAKWEQFEKLADELVERKTKFKTLMRNNRYVTIEKTVFEWMGTRLKPYEKYQFKGTDIPHLFDQEATMWGIKKMYPQLEDEFHNIQLVDIEIAVSGR
jgi:hypothetical protein